MKKISKSHSLKFVYTFCLLVSFFIWGSCLVACGQKIDYVAKSNGETKMNVDTKSNVDTKIDSNLDHFGPAYVGETRYAPSSTGTIVSTDIVLDRDNAELHLALPPCADPESFHITAPGRIIVSIETHWQEGKEGTFSIIIVYFDANAIPNTEKARAHMYPNAKPNDPMPVMNMVNLAATYSYTIATPSPLNE